MDDKNPLKYGDKVFYAYPPMDRKTVIVDLDQFEKEIREWTVLFQFEDLVVVTSEEYIQKRVKDSKDYWMEKDEEGRMRNFSTYNLEKAAVSTIYRRSLFASKEEAVTYQKSCIDAAKEAMDRFKAQLDEEL